MCVPKKKQRNKQRQAPVETSKPKDLTNEDQCLTPPSQKLLRLEVTGAVHESGTNYWEVVSDSATIRIKAVTEPDTSAVWAKLIWNVDVSDPTNQVAEMPRVDTGETRIAARLSGQSWVYVDINIYNLISVQSNVLTKLTDREQHWKVYEASATTPLKVVTEPNDDSVWSKLDWSEGSAGAIGDERKIAIDAAGEKTVTVTLGKTNPKRLTADLLVAKWPQLELALVNFGGYKVINDGTAEMGQEFTRVWKKGFPDPAAKLVTAKCQSVLCFAGGSVVKLNATFTVTEKPTVSETVWVAGQATIGGTKITWQASIRVDPASTEVDMPDTAGDKTVPAAVAVLDPLELEWFQTKSDNTTWAPTVGKSKNLTYVTLKAPLVKPYWTLLDISCRAGDGKTTEDDLVPAAFEPFTKHTGDGKGFKRKGDDVETHYYVNGSDLSKDDGTVFTTEGILSRADGNGRCGGWANLLIHLYKIHGITSAGKVWFIRGTNVNNPGYKQGYGFLVKNCQFDAVGGLGGPYTHEGRKTCKKQDGAPGQGKTNPKFEFGDHVVVSHNGKLYDPSYGVGPKGSNLEYEQAAIAGLSWIAPGKPNKDPTDTSKIWFDQSDGTKQYIPKSCSPGFIVHKVTGGEKVADIATKYSLTESGLFDHPVNSQLKAKRTTADKVQDNDVILIPRDSTMTMLDAHNI